MDDGSQLIGSFICLIMTQFFSEGEVAFHSEWGLRWKTSHCHGLFSQRTGKSIWV